ncbi:hypothetical protein JTB14_033527 [Gonioctena quinquepunctata]|nr:hypothetical protein JTB14_033527 [Gonioctena quinquepunctata]
MVIWYLHHAKPRRRKTWSDMLKEEAKQFCLNTALHGYRFIVLPKRILLERIVWGVVCFVALTAALTLLFVAYFDFQKNPTVLVTDSNHYPVWHYTFPAVTVCDFNMISKKAAIQLAKNLTEVSRVNDLVQQFRLFAQLFRRIRADTPFRNFSNLQDILDEKKLPLETVLRQLAPSCDDILVRCLWKGEEKRCESIFEQIKTSEGFCCSFNYFALKNHTFTGALASKAPREPRRVSACGYQTGLEVMVNNDPDDYLATFTPSIGQKILLHNPYDFPDWNVQVMVNQRKIVNLISISPTITYSTDSIQSLPVEIRKCLFPKEKALIYFAKYTYHNCMVECRMNLTLKQCHCIPVYISQEAVHTKYKLCSLRDIPCLNENFDFISSSLPGFDHNFIDSSYEYGTEKSECDCLPDCEITEYLGEMSYGVLSRDFSMNQPSLYGGITIKNHSVFRVFYNDLVGVKNRRDVKYEWHTLLAYYGGLLGLFLGFSFVSGVEIIYFFTIRLIADATKNSAKKNNTKRVRTIYSPKIRPLVHDNLDPKRLNLYPEIGIRKRSNSNNSS